jgi:hypothetical protein
LAFGGFADLVDDDGGFEAGVGCELAERLFERADDDLCAGLFVPVEAVELDRLARVEERDAAAGDDSFFDLPLCLVFETLTGGGSRS